MYQSTPQNQASRKARRSGRGSAAGSGDLEFGADSKTGERIAQSSGTRPTHANTLRQGGMGPAMGNGSSSRHAESAAAAQACQLNAFAANTCGLLRIQGRV